MTATEELITILKNFSTEQLDKFLADNLTQSILQAEEEAEPYQVADSLCG